MNFKVILLGTPFFKNELSNSLKDIADLHIYDYTDQIVDDNSLYVYYGNSPEDASWIYSKLDTDKIVKGQRIIPVVRDLRNFNDVIPKEIASINGIQISNSNEIGKLKCLIEERLGLIESNRKVFISYKRCDSSGLANQLFDALIKSHYKPFLDSYSIYYGVDFQEYLKHELSDSSVLIFINSPHYDLSEFTREEFTICNQLQMGMVEIIAPGARKHKESGFAVSYELDEQISQNKQFDENTINSIIMLVENNRLEMESFRRDALRDQLSSMYSDLSTNPDGKSYTSASAKHTYYPILHIPTSFDIQSIQNMHLPNSQGVYNGLYCRRDVYAHLQWLNGISPIKLIDITKTN